MGLVTSSDRPKEARELIDYLRRPAEQEIFARNNHEFPAVPGAKPSDEIAQFGTFERDPIEVARAGERLDEALKLMDEVGWD